MTSQTSAKIKNMGTGTVIGAVVAIVLGFWFGGWVTASTAKEISAEAVLSSRSAICVAQFVKAPGYEDRLKTFRNTDSWKRGEFVAQGGWDKMPGEETARIYVTNACADGIEILLDS